MRALRNQLWLAGFTLFVLVLASGCGNSSPSPTTPTPTSGPAADVTITVVGMNGSNSFSPNPVTVRVGQTVSWKNSDSLTHTATADGGAFNTGSISPGGTSAPITMTTAGSYPYRCTPHPTMVGTLVVQ
jgi:plastocyanin